MEITLLYWYWLVLGMILIMFEMFVPSFTVLWFGAGACLVGMLLFFLPELSISWQVLIWTISSVAATYTWFRYLKPRSVNKTMAGLSREAIVGETGHIIVIPHAERRGRLRFATPKLGADEWDIISEHPVELGDRVVVLDVSGNALLVKKQ